MKELLKTNCFDTLETMVIMGSCLPSIQPKAYEQLKEISKDIYEVCLEETHLNMVVIKIIGMIARDNQLIQIPIEVISLSKNLTQLKIMYQK